MFSQVARYPASNLGNHPRPWPCRRTHAVRRGDRVELTIGSLAAQGRRRLMRVVSCPSHPWWIAQHRAGLYRESRAVQPSSAQVRVSPKARTIGSAPAARRLPLRLSTTMLGLFPHPSRANSSRPRHSPPVGVAVVASGRLPPAGSSSSVVLVAVVGLGWLDVARRARPTGACAWSAGWSGGCQPDQIGGQVAGAGAPREPARSAAVDPGPGGRLDASELFARGGRQ